MEEKEEKKMKRDRKKKVNAGKREERGIKKKGE